MSAPLVIACLWLVTANVIGMLPSRDHHWRAAYGLIAVGVPIAAWVTVEAGAVWGLVVVLAGASVLRWPLMLAMRMLRRGAGGRDDDA